MAIGDIIVGIDIGTTKVCLGAGEVNNFGQIETICCTSHKCNGLKKGKIVNEDEISLSISKTIKQAEEETELNEMEEENKVEEEKRKEKEKDIKNE